MDGTCNNAQQTLFGAAFTPYLRLIAASYDDGRQAPNSELLVSCRCNKTVSDRNRPSARDVVRFLLSANTEQPTGNSAMLMQWGQFVSHDMARTTQLANGECAQCSFQSFNCVNVPTQRNDQRCVWVAFCIQVKMCPGIQFWQPSVSARRSQLTNMWHGHTRTIQRKHRLSRRQCRVRQFICRYVPIS
jgi:hypothetical protein